MLHIKSTALTLFYGNVLLLASLSTRIRAVASDDAALTVTIRVGLCSELSDIGTFLMTVPLPVASVNVARPSKISLWIHVGAGGVFCLTLRSKCFQK